MRVAVIGVEGDMEFGPVDSWVVELNPRHAEDNRVVGHTCDFKLNALSVGTDRELDGKGVVCDISGGD